MAKKTTITVKPSHPDFNAVQRLLRNLETARQRKEKERERKKAAAQRERERIKRENEQEAKRLKREREQEKREVKRRKLQRDKEQARARKQAQAGQMRARKELQARQAREQRKRAQFVAKVRKHFPKHKLDIAIDLYHDLLAKRANARARRAMREEEITPKACAKYPRMSTKAAITRYKEDLRSERRKKQK